MLKYLDRRHYKQKGGNKYHIDCNLLQVSIDNIDINSIIRYKNDVSILSGVIKNINSIKKNTSRDTNNNVNSLIKKAKYIVVKIGFADKTLEKEFQIGKLLNDNNISGYINYICLFNCYDDTYEKPKPVKICDATPKPENNKKVLIMPYINEGSIKNFKWSSDKFDILRSVIIQCIMSSMMAFDKIGFIHGDFHLDNILLQKTKKKYIEYTLDTANGLKIFKIPTYGYKIVIMDFENSWIIKDKPEGLYTYWSNLYNMLSRLKYDLHYNNSLVNIKNLDSILSFIGTQMNHKSNYIHTINILQNIEHLDIQLETQPEHKFIYNPNIF